MQSEENSPSVMLEDERRPYRKPAIVLEQELETHAGSPLTPGDDIFDPLQLDGG